MNKRRILRAASWVVAAGISHAAIGATVGPTAYTGFADSPFNGVDFSAGYFHIEDFEDALLNVPGVNASAGAPFAPGGITDSVDEDDGAIDGSGTAGNSFFSGGGSAGITFAFDASVLGSLPTHAGIVWTDGSGTIQFEAFDGDGISLGTIGPFSETGSPDDNFNGGTAEDRFFGFADAVGGIGSIFISNTAGGIEVDHLQFGGPEGVSPPPPPPPPPPGGVIPLPAPLWAGMAMFATAGAAYRRITRRPRRD
jgi:hypothetical protein